jgi:hypothetical protein
LCTVVFEVPIRRENKQNATLAVTKRGLDKGRHESIGKITKSENIKTIFSSALPA